MNLKLLSDMSMKNKSLTIGVLGLKPGLQNLLQNLGIRVEALNTPPSDPTNYSIIIVHRALNNSEKHELAKFQAENRSSLTHEHDFLGVLYTFESGIVPLASQPKDIRRRSLMSDDLLGTPLESFAYIDVYSTIRLYDQDEHLYSAVYLETGGVGYFGFPIENPLERTGYTRKRFPSNLEFYPNELVSQVHRQKLQDLLQFGLEKVLFSINLPWIQNWYFPTEQPIITLRIDTDFGTQKSMHELFELAGKNGAKLSNFLHVQAHEDWLSWFSHYPIHEYAIHGYQHALIDSSYQLYQDIEQANETMKEQGLEAKGYAAPYGIWSKTLSNVLDKYPFTYSSEFTHGYDGFPYFVEGNKRLQIPMHPICTGSLHRYGATTEDFKGYFKRIIEAKTAQWQPIMLYHHPLQPGANALDFAMRYANEKGIHWLRYDEWAEFWIKRSEQRYRLEYSASQGIIAGEIHGDLPILIKTDHDRGFLLYQEQAKSGVKIEEQKHSLYWKPHTESLVNKMFLEERFSKPWELWKESLIQYRNRIRI